MFDREKNLFGSYAAKRISRRDLLDGAAKLGVAGIAANAAFASSVSQAMAADFNWKGQAGKTVKLTFSASEDRNLPTTFAVDDVALTAG